MVRMAAAALTRETLEPLRGNPDALIEMILRQAAVLAEQRELIAKQQQAITVLEKRVAQLEQLLQDKGSGGGAAPFRVPKQKRKASPKKPGRGKGHQGSHRSKPPKADLVIEVALEKCPDCGTTIEAPADIEQHLIELPAIKPLVIKLCTQRGWCPCCHKTQASHHPLQVSTATGAAGTHLGPNSLATVAQLRYAAGLTLGTTRKVLDVLFHLPLSRGGLSQAMDRVADRLEGDYRKLGEELLEAVALHTDETGWWLENERASLWVTCHPEGTHFRVVEHKDRATFYETVPPDWPGVLVTDCLSVYDDATPLQQKCYAHHLKAISQARERLEAPSPWLDQLRALLKGAIALGKEREALDDTGFAERLQALKTACRAILLEEPRRCPVEESVRNRLWKQRDHLFVFLEHEGVDATNNLAERQLRPAVIRRKLSCGNKTRRGAKSFEILASLAATCQQTGASFLQKIVAAMPLAQA